MTTFTALALDPGGTTGWAMYRATKMITPPDDAVDMRNPKPADWYDYLYEWYNEEWRVGHLEGSDHADDLLTLLELNHTADYHIVVERFTPRPGKVGAQLEVAPRYITICEMFAKERSSELLHQKVDLVLQNVGQAKPFVKDRNIKKLGLWSPGQKHAMDAMRHLLFYLVNGPYKRKDLLEKGWKF